MMSCRRSFCRSLAVGILAGCSLFAGGNVFAEPSVTGIATYAPEKNNNNVKVYFYIDGHKWMRQRRSMAFAKAIEALQNLLADRTNPLDEAFRELGYNVETNTGIAYLFTPDIVEPFNLSTKDDLEDLGKKYTGQDNFTCNDFIKKILTSVPSANSVVCIITNNTVFPEKHGICYRDKERNITIFVLNAGRISVDTGKTFSPTWKVKDWEQFLAKSIGRNANDIANIIARDYYMLTEQEKSYFKKVIGSADKHCVVLKNLFLLPGKDMWKREIIFNGKTIAASQNEVILTPKSGQNDLSVSLVSPVGYRYTIKWGGDEFLYTELTKEEQKTLADALKYVEQTTNFAQVDIENVKTSKSFLNKPVKKTLKDALIKSAGQIVSTAETYAELVKQIRELKAIIAAAKHVDQERKVTELEKRLTGATQEQIKQLQQEVAMLKEEVEKTRKADEFEKYKNNVIAKIQREISAHNEKDFKNAADLQDMHRKANNAKSIDELKKIENALAQWKPEPKPHVRDQILKTLREQKLKFASGSRDISNYSEIDDLIRRAEIVDESELSNMVWTPVYSTKNLVRDIEEKIKDLLPRRDEIKPESWSKLLSIKEEAVKNTANDIGTVSSLRKKFEAWIPTYNVLSEATKNNLIEKCKEWIESYPASDFDSEDQIATLEDIIKGINDCKEKDVKRFAKLSADAKEILDIVPDRKGGIILPVIIALIVVAGIVFGIIRKFLNKKIATLEFKKTIDSEEIPPQELSIKQDFNLEVLGCKIDIHVTCLKGDNGEIQYQIISPNMPAWISRVGGVKKELSDTPIYEADGEFLLYETKNSMREFARIELRQISE